MRYTSKGWIVVADFKTLTVEVEGPQGTLKKEYKNADEVFKRFKACKKYLEDL